MPTPPAVNSYPAPAIPCPGIPGNLLTPPNLMQDPFWCGRCLGLYNDYRFNNDPSRDPSRIWMPRTAYHQGNLVVPSVFNTAFGLWNAGKYTGWMFRAQNDGLSGTYQSDGHGNPAWPTTVGTSVRDGGVNGVTWRAEPEPLCGFVDVENGAPDGGPDPRPLPLQDRGFDDPQADPDPTFVSTGKVATLHYKRADIYEGLENPPPPLPQIFPYQQRANDAENGNPPWGSQPAVSDNDADGLSDPINVNDRHNRGANAGFYNTREIWQYAQQFPNDAFTDSSHPTARCAGGANANQPCNNDSQCPLSTCSSPLGPCNLYVEDCGGIAHFPREDCTGVEPCLKDAAGLPYHPYPIVTPPPLPETWPLVPFHRDWVPTDGDAVTAIKRLLRFASSLVSFDQSQSHMFEYQLAEDSNQAILTGVGTPIAGSLRDAYNYLYRSVFHEDNINQQDDPYVDCRVYKIVLITDGLDSSEADPCAGGPTGGGPSKDLGTVLLPEREAGARQRAYDLCVAERRPQCPPVAGVPVIVVALGIQLPDNACQNPPCFDPRLQCIADNSGGRVIPANNRQDLVDALESILDYVPSSRFFASSALPAFAASSGDVGVIGSVVPSHLFPAVSPSPGPTAVAPARRSALAPESPAVATSWAIWNGQLKGFKLDNNGDIPIIVTPVTPQDTPAAGTPTPTPTPQTIGGQSGFPDEGSPDNSDPTLRRPVWNASRVLGYTSPVTPLVGGMPSSNPIGAVSVWPGRKMVWARTPVNGQPTVPLDRQEFMPNTAPCSGTNPGDCFYDLITAMGLNSPSPTATPLPSQVTKAIRAVQFLRGGRTDDGGRDQVLTDLGTYGTVTAGTKYSYNYPDDIPGGATTELPAYPHKLGDIFHSEPAVLLPPRRFSLLSQNVTPRTGACGWVPDCSYASFARYHQYRRKTVFVGSNDGFLHAFDAGVWDRDTTHFSQVFDLGTGQEIFAYAPKSVMNLKFPNLLRFPPDVQYFVDGTPAMGDVFIGPTDSQGAAVPDGRAWKTVLVGGLRQGGRGYYALDVTQPDRVHDELPVTDINYGSKLNADKGSSPDCLEAGGHCEGSYPTVLWEFTDDCVIDGNSCVSNMGETWSRPVVGRIKVTNGGTTEDRYVAIFGGGFDMGFKLGTTVSDTDRSSGRAFYIMDVERGKRVYKATSGTRSGSNEPVLFAPMPAPPAVADVDDDGYLDVAYIGDLVGRMWKIDLRSGVCVDCETASETLTFPQPPFLLFDATTLDGQFLSTQPIQPIFLEAGIIFMAGGTTPTLGIAFGTGYRAELMQPNLRVDGGGNQVPYVNRFYFVRDTGDGVTLHELDLNNVTPSDGIEPGPGPLEVQDPTVKGFFLNFGLYDEKATSTVFATQGILTLVTFSPSQGDPCTNTGNSFRYRFFFLNGRGAVTGVLSPFGPGGVMSQFRESIGAGLAGGTQSQSPSGTVIDSVIFWTGQINQQNSSFLKTNNESWKEQ